ncbi:MAG: hypothetical protein R6V83_01790 [Candidatus Thorarchaeota archaeon]
MPEGVFVVRLDKMSGFLVEKKYPSSLRLNEKLLNLIYYEHETGKREQMKFFESEGKRFGSFTHTSHPAYFVCFVLNPEEKPEIIRDQFIGMGRLIIQLAIESPDKLYLGQILEKGSVLPKRSDEQIFTDIFTTPSTALLLERLEKEGLEKAAALSLWLKNQIRSEDMDLRETVKPLMKSGAVEVKMVGKASEMVFLIKDVFAHRAPPVKALLHVEKQEKEIAQKYREEIKKFFSPAGEGGYNPTIPVEDPNSPLLEDRQKIAEIMSDIFHYRIIEALRQKPLTAAEIADETALPDQIVEDSLWTLHDNHIAINIGENITWVLLSDPRIDCFLPEFVLPIVANKVRNKKVQRRAAQEYLKSLMQSWKGECI